MRTGQLCDLGVPELLAAGAALRNEKNKELRTWSRTAADGLLPEYM